MNEEYMNVGCPSCGTINGGFEILPDGLVKCNECDSYGVASFSRALEILQIFRHLGVLDAYNEINEESLYGELDFHREDEDMGDDYE